MFRCRTFCGNHSGRPCLSHSILAVRPSLWGLFICGEAGAALAEAVAFNVHLEIADVVGEAVQQRTGRAFIAEGFCPFLEGTLRCYQSRAALVALRDQLEEKMGTVLLKGTKLNALMINSLTLARLRT